MKQKNNNKIEQKGFRSKVNSKFEYYWQRFSGNCPSSKELENSSVKKLAQQLKGKTEKETLTNILEWQDRNIIFWFERYQILRIFLVIGLTIFLLQFPTLYDMISQSCYFLISVALVLLMAGITIMSISFWRKLPIKQIVYLFKIDMPINLLLEHKFGVCRDYAKLTFCLLQTIYPASKICLVNIPNHVATGIFVDNKLYMLDQKLPIKTINGWHKKNKSEMDAYILKGKSLHKIPINVEPATLNKDKLETELSKRLNLSEKVTDGKTSELSIKWKQGERYYDDDEIVNYSLAKWLKNKIADEVLALNQICKLEITPKDKDLYFKITYVPST